MLLVIISQTGSLNGKIDAYRLNMFFFVVYNEVKTTKNLVLMGLYIYIPRYSFSGDIYIYIHPPSGSRYIYILYWFIDGVICDGHLNLNLGWANHRTR